MTGVQTCALPILIKKKISNKKAISAVELEFISGTFLFPFAIVLLYLIEQAQLDYDNFFLMLLKMIATTVAPKRK